MYKLFLSLFFVSYFLKTQAQPIYVQSTNKSAMPVFTQSKIDSLESPANGMVVFNATSGCINYFFDNNWFELCGNCTPKPQWNGVDSVSQKKSLLYVFFKTVPKTSFKFKIVGGNEEWKIAENGKAALNIPPNMDKCGVHVQIENSCGKKDTTFFINVKPFTISKIENIMVDGINIPTRKISSLRWMCQDYVSPKTKIQQKYQPTFLTLSNTKQVCPDGWSLPSNADWLNLLEHYEQANEQLFLPPNDNNYSIGLQKSGFYSVEDNKYYPIESAYYWSKDKTNELQSLISISIFGHILLSEKAEKLSLPVRCVKYE